MKPPVHCLLLAATNAHAAVTLDWVTAGNAGNANDTTGYGAVAHAYQISKYEVTNAQYAEFLNTVDASGDNTLDLYNTNMGGSARSGIAFNSGAADGFKYEIKAGMDSKPVV